MPKMGFSFSLGTGENEMNKTEVSESKSGRAENLENIMFLF